MTVDGSRSLSPAVDPVLVQHPLDRQALSSLKAVRGFEFFASRFVDAGVERMEYLLAVASGVRVGPAQLPSLHRHLRTACAVLGVPEPELYVTSAVSRSVSAGPSHPYTVLTSGVLGLMDDDELAAVVAHEVGHVKAGHLLYTSMARAVDFYSGVANAFSLGISNFVTAPIQVALLTWERWAELTADRAALLVVREPRVCLRMLMKLAAGTTGGAEPLDVDAYIDQVRAHRRDFELTLHDRFHHVGATMQRGSLPITLQRAQALLDWYESGGFARALAGHGEDRPRCPACGQPAEPEHSFCTECGARLKG
jgi:Zn-dependent protease with chaperone function